MLTASPHKASRRPPTLTSGAGPCLLAPSHFQVCHRLDFANLEPHPNPSTPKPPPISDITRGYAYPAEIAYCITILPHDVVTLRAVSQTVLHQATTNCALGTRCLLSLPRFPAQSSFFSQLRSSEPCNHKPLEPSTARSKPSTRLATSKA